MKITKETFLQNLLHYALYESASSYDTPAKRNPVDAYIKELIGKIEDYELTEKLFNPDLSGKKLEKILLNGAKDWQEYSEGGCSLTYNEDIAKRLGVKVWRITLLTMQAQKLKNASACIIRAYKVIKNFINKD